MKIAAISILTIMLLSTSVLGAGCRTRPELYGQPLAEQQITPIGDLLAQPAKFEGKRVKIRGTITTECPAGCWFNLKDDTGTVYVNIHPSNLVIPQRQGHQATVEGVVKTENGRTSVIGSGVEV